MEEMLGQKFFFFYDFLNDGFIDFAMQFYEDPFGFDVNKAKKEAEGKEKNRISGDIEVVFVNPDTMNKDKREGSPYKVTLPNLELDATVEESFGLIPDL